MDQLDHVDLQALGVRLDPLDKLVRGVLVVKLVDPDHQVPPGHLARAATVDPADLRAHPVNQELQVEQTSVSDIKTTFVMELG